MWFLLLVLVCCVLALLLVLAAPRPPPRPSALVLLVLGGRWSSSHTIHLLLEANKGLVERLEALGGRKVRELVVHVLVGMHF